MFDELMTLETAALQRLTDERRVSGSIPQEVDDTLSEFGVYWDEVDLEYFSIEVFQKEIYERLVAEYTHENYS